MTECFAGPIIDQFYPRFQRRLSYQERQDVQRSRKQRMFCFRAILDHIKGLIDGYILGHAVAANKDVLCCGISKNLSLQVEWSIYQNKNDLNCFFLFTSCPLYQFMETLI